MLAARRVLHNPATSGPPDKNHLMVWYDATQLTGLADGASLGTWPDLSGHGRDGIGSATPYPTYAATGLAGKPAVRWASTSHSYVNLIPWIWGTGIITAAGVFQFTTLGSPYPGGVFSSNSYGTWEFGIDTNNQWSLYSGNKFDTSGASGLTSPHDFAAIFDTLSFVPALDIDGANMPLTNTGLYGAVNYLDLIQVGAADSLGPMIGGVIGELLLYDQAEDLAALHSYLQTKWGI